jgi:hypothetical protein
LTPITTDWSAAIRARPQRVDVEEAQPLLVPHVSDPVCSHVGEREADRLVDRPLVGSPLVDEVDPSRYAHARSTAASAPNRSSTTPLPNVVVLALVRDGVLDVAVHGSRRIRVHRDERRLDTSEDVLEPALEIRTGP